MVGKDGKSKHMDRMVQEIDYTINTLEFYIFKAKNILK